MKYIKQMVCFCAFGILLFFCSEIKAQHTNKHGCGVDHATYKMYKKNPQLIQQIHQNRVQMQDQERKVQKKGSFKNGTCTNLLNRTIPMVFHVIHQGGPEKIDIAQIEAAIQEATLDFNMANTDRLQPGDPFYEDQACVGLNFELATQDPYGNATTGVTYTDSYYTLDGINFEGQIKSLIYWPRERYLNVWITTQVGSASGFAHYPETVDGAASANRDGIVMRYDYVGTTGEADPAIVEHERRHILAHEIGHWLGLQHTWGDLGPNEIQSFPSFGVPENCSYDDFVLDTPNSIGFQEVVYPNEYASCSDLPNLCGGDSSYNGEFNTDCFSTLPAGWEDNIPTNVFNMMEYGAEVMFTEGQKERMRSYINSPTAQRNEIGNFPNETSIPDNVQTLVMDGYFLIESPNDDGTIYNEIILELSQGSFNFNNGYISNANVESTNVPNGLTLFVQSVPNEPNKAKVILLDNAENHSNLDDVENISLTLKSGAFGGVLLSNLHNYNSTTQSITIDGLNIDFKDFEPIYSRYTVNELDNVVCASPSSNTEEYYAALYLEHGGYMAIQYEEEDGNFYLVLESGVDIKVATVIGTNNVAYYNAGTQINNISASSFKSLTRSTAADDPNALRLTNTNGEKYIAFKITTQETTGSRVLFGWLRVEQNGNSFCGYDAVYHTASSGLALQTGELIAPCDSQPTDSSIDIGTVFIGQTPLVQDMNLESQTYDIEFRLSSDASSIYNYHVWGLWIDVDQNDYYDYDEAFVFIPYIETDDLAASGFSYTNFHNYSYTISSLDLTGIQDGVYNMRIIYTPYNYNTELNSVYNINPCMPYISGSTNDFSIVIGDGNPPPPPPTEDCCPEDANYDLLNAPPPYTAVTNNISAIHTMVPSTHAVSFQAGNSITLKNGFIAEQGRSLFAYIQNCNPVLCDNNRFENNTNNTEGAISIFNIYPNPVESQLNIDYRLLEASNVSVELYNITGKLEQIILTNTIQEVGTYNNTIDMSGLKAGVYLVKIQVGYEKTTQKLVKL